VTVGERLSRLRSRFTPAGCDQLRQVTVEIRSPAGAGSAQASCGTDLVVTNATLPVARVLVSGRDERWIEAHSSSPIVARTLPLFRIPRCGVAAAWAIPTPAVGALVVALGHPLGLRDADGRRVHALGRRGLVDDVHPRGRASAPALRCGPLATRRSVSRMNTMIAGGLALAIPINDVGASVVSATASTT